MVSIQLPSLFPVPLAPYEVFPPMVLFLRTVQIGLGQPPSRIHSIKHGKLELAMPVAETREHDRQKGQQRLPG